MAGQIAISGMVRRAPEVDEALRELRRAYPSPVVAILDYQDFSALAGQMAPTATAAEVAALYSKLRARARIAMKKAGRGAFEDMLRQFINVALSGEGVLHDWLCAEDVAELEGEREWIRDQMSDQREADKVQERMAAQHREASV